METINALVRHNTKAPCAISDPAFPSPYSERFRATLKVKVTVGIRRLLVFFWGWGLSSKG